MDNALAERVHRNLMEVQSWMGEAEGGATHYRDGELFFSGRSEMPFLNGVMRAPSAGDGADLLRRARSFFFARERGFVTYVWPGDPELEEAAVTAGMIPVLDRYPEMVCSGALEAIPGAVQPVADIDDARAYWDICDRAYPSLGFPPGLFSEAFEPEELLDANRGWACIARKDEHPVACASVWMAAGVGMVGWVAALPEARGLGLAAACTVRATNRAFELGAEIASLQASHMGEQVYRRLGYEEVFAYRLFGTMPE